MTDMKDSRFQHCKSAAGRPLSLNRAWIVHGLSMTHVPGASPDHTRRRRVVGLAASGLVFEGALLWVAWRAPAFAVIMHPVYVTVALAFALAIWHASRRREDRRHADRRDAPEGD
jgi:hypothetical protein